MWSHGSGHSRSQVACHLLLSEGCRLRPPLSGSAHALHLAPTAAGAVVMGPLVLLPSVHLGLSGGFVFTGEASGLRLRLGRCCMRTQVQ